jgi:hypothetical protein
VLTWFLICSVKDFFVEEQPKNYGDMYKNFTSLIETVNSNVLCKLDGDGSGAEAAKSTAAAAAKNSDGRSSPIQRYYYGTFFGNFVVAENRAEGTLI